MKKQLLAPLLLLLLAACSGSAESPVIEITGFFIEGDTKDYSEDMASIPSLKVGDEVTVSLTLDGYGFWWAFFISLFVYAGSMQFVLVTLLTAGASLWYTLIMTLFVNGRHMFYGLSFVEKFKKMGVTYPYMIFSLTDETFSLLCDLKVPVGMREERVSFYISLLDHCYWLLGSCVGAVAGSVLPINTTGIDFSMTALFTVIVVNQWMDTKEHKPAIIGGAVGVLCLILLGADAFLLPALTITAIILLGVKKKCYIPSES